MADKHFAYEGTSSCCHSRFLIVTENSLKKRTIRCPIWHNEENSYISLTPITSINDKDKEEYSIMVKNTGEKDYVYFGICKYNESQFLIVTPRDCGSFKNEQTLICPICDDGFGELSLNRIRRTRKRLNDKNRIYALKLYGTATQVYYENKEAFFAGILPLPPSPEHIRILN